MDARTFELQTHIYINQTFKRKISQQGGCDVLGTCCTIHKVIVLVHYRHLPHHMFRAAYNK